MPDYSIAMQGQPVNIKSPAQAVQEAAQAKNAMLRNRAIGQEMQDREALNQAYRDAGGNINAMVDDPRLGFDASMQIKGMQAEQTRAQAQAKQADVDQQIKMLEYGSQILSGASDQASWDSARQQFASIFGDQAANNLPAQYDKKMQQDMVMRGVSMRDKIAMQRDEAKYQQQEMLQNMRHQQTLAAISARGDGGSGDARYNTIYDTQGKAFFVNPKDPTAPPIPIKTETGDQFAKPPAPTKAFTQDQSKAAIYGKRIEQAASILDDIGSDYNPTSIAVKGTLEDTPLVGKYAGIYANSKIDPKSRQVEQAQLNILNAILRQESGATIGSPEFKKAEKQYFIVPGDDEQTKANKRQNLQTVIAGMKNESGPAWLTDEKVDASNQNPVITHPKHGEITEDDIQTTMKARNMTREQVLQKLGVQ